MNHGLRFLVTLFLVMLGADAVAATSIYLFADGTVQGVIEGDVTFAPERDTIETLSFEWGSERGIDPRNGLPSGQRVSSVIVFTKPQDSASVNLRRALGEVERFQTFEFRQYEGVASQDPVLRITLQDAYLLLQTTDVDPDGRSVERWAVGYQSIEWSNERDLEQFLDTVGSSGNGTE